MKRIITIIIFLLINSGFLFAQVDIDPARVDQGAYQPDLQELSLSKFEDAGFWRVHVPIDDGVIIHRTIEGGPDAKEKIDAVPELENADVDEYILGVRTDFFRRTISTLSFLPLRPIPVPGVVHTFSIWVAGRNTQYKLSLVLRDRFGHISVLPMGKLNFLGWKKMVVAVPPSVQESRFYVGNNDFNMGLEVIGLSLESELLETYGQYYIYFDDLRAVTDVTPLHRDPDDPIDNW